MHTEDKNLGWSVDGKYAKAETVSTTAEAVVSDTATKKAISADVAAMKVLSVAVAVPSLTENQLSEGDDMS